MKADNTIDVLFIYTNIHGFHLDVYNFGVGYLSSVLKNNGFKTKLSIVRTKSDYQDVLRVVQTHKPKVIGFSSVSSQFVFVAELAKEIKEIYNCVIVCGGVHTTIFPECLQSAPALDGVFIGECEEPFLNFVTAVDRNDNFKTCKNFCYMENGEMVKNSLSPRISNFREVAVS